MVYIVKIRPVVYIGAMKITVTHGHNNISGKVEMP